jgi:hypothetical protein
MQEISAYQQDVATIPDQELRSLLAEIEGFRVVDDDGESYLDTEHEYRACELSAEIERRRWAALTPAEQEAEIAFGRKIVGVALGMLEEQLVVAAQINRDYDSVFAGRGN